MKSRELMRQLEKAGCVRVPGKGDHASYVAPDGHKMSVPTGGSQNEASTGCIHKVKKFIRRHGKDSTVKSEANIKPGGKPLPFRDALKRCRDRRGLSRKELADNLGVPHPRVSDWEEGFSMPDANELGRLLLILPGMREFSAPEGAVEATTSAAPPSNEPSDNEPSGDWDDPDSYDRDDHRETEEPPNEITLEPNMPLHEAIKSARLSENLSRAELGELVGRSEWAVKNWEDPKGSRPYQDAYDKLRELLPKLRALPPLEGLHSAAPRKKPDSKPQPTKVIVTDVKNKEDEAPMKPEPMKPEPKKVETAAAPVTATTAADLGVAYAMALVAARDAEKALEVAKERVKSALAALRAGVGS